MWSALRMAAVKAVVGWTIIALAIGFAAMVMSIKDTNGYSTDNYNLSTPSFSDLRRNLKD